MSEDIIVNKIVEEIIHKISMDWKERTDKHYKIIEKSQKHTLKQNERLSNALTLEREKYNQLAHNFNLEHTETNILITKLQNQILKLKEEKEK